MAALVAATVAAFAIAIKFPQSKPLS